MANEEKKDFNAMLHDSKDMPKFQMITDPMTIERYGGNRMYFAPCKCQYKNDQKVENKNVHLPRAIPQPVLP